METFRSYIILRSAKIILFSEKWDLRTLPFHSLAAITKLLAFGKTRRTTLSSPSGRRHLNWLRFHQTKKPAICVAVVFFHKSLNSFQVLIAPAEIVFILVIGGHLNRCYFRVGKNKSRPLDVQNHPCFVRINIRKVRKGTRLLKNLFISLFVTGVGYICGQWCRVHFPRIVKGIFGTCITPLKFRGWMKVCLNMVSSGFFVPPR